MILIALGLVLLACAAVLLWLAFTAPDGFETATGFREGREPFVPPGAATASAINHRGRLPAAASETLMHTQSDSDGEERKHA